MLGLCGRSVDFTRDKAVAERADGVYESFSGSAFGVCNAFGCGSRDMRCQVLMCTDGGFEGFLSVGLADGMSATQKARFLIPMSMLRIRWGWVSCFLL